MPMPIPVQMLCLQCRCFLEIPTPMLIMMSMLTVVHELINLFLHMSMLALVANYGLCLHMYNAGSKMILNVSNANGTSNAESNTNADANDNINANANAQG